MTALILSPSEVVTAAVWDDYPMTVRIGTPDPDCVRNRLTGEIVKRTEAQRRGGLVAPIVLVQR